MQLKKIKIGSLETENNVFLAPLAGYTNSVFREICFELGAGLTFTEMVSAKGLVYGIGLTEGNIIAAEFARACESAGADIICVHGRVREKIYAGPVNCAAIAEAKSAVDIPVIANGGIFSSADAGKLIDRTGADGVMIARGAMFRPWIFARITGREYDAHAVVSRQLDDTLAAFGERFACVYMRKMIAFYLKSKPNGAALRGRLMQAPTTDAVREILNEIEF